MTQLTDTPIPFDPRHPDAINPGLVYLSWVAWPEQTAAHRANRERFTTAMAAAVYKQSGRHRPPSAPRVKPETIAPTAREAIGRIQLLVAPAVFMVQRIWVTQGYFHGLGPWQQAQLADAFAVSAGRLRRQDTPPVTLHDIGPDAWRAARPALAMAMALPVG
jgi:hypothetical protein